jgi:hypothetical protein
VAKLEVLEQEPHYNNLEPVVSICVHSATYYAAYIIQISISVFVLVPVERVSGLAVNAYPSLHYSG